MNNAVQVIDEEIKLEAVPSPSIKQVLQLADKKKNTWNSMVNNANPNKLSLTVSSRKTNV